ncbi:HNH endonuclease signature motif containing protein [Litorihabitans aurantiacus]|uniref:HNH nuclease domain-containing protein n=1 Tax=Litorihabitans aurantiacus TaxID=1930061 RepID=A0AA37XHQ1_9MICO|nr:DUF222 domain-containing protein [Litorihabitans aurantiacus]GMA30073.1 hypothetical protein GCM10025875_00650 [Litorihabitans aurantiacus]GMA33572.1 hypothetical protein GCM10025875_35640 [Litorihabitans aurantiacus]
MFDGGVAAWDLGRRAESPAAVREHLGLGAPDDGGAPQELLERLAQLTEYARLRSLDSAALVETIAALAGVEAWAAAAQRDAAAALEARQPVVERERRRSGRVEMRGSAADSIAMRLGISRHRAARLVGEGRLYEDVLHPVGTALAQGRIDAGKASVFAEVLVDAEPEVSFAVCEQVLPDAPGLAHQELRARVQAVVVQVDPGAARERAVRATARRRLESVRLLPDGQASVRLVAPLMDVASVHAMAEAAARAARAAGDARTLDQLRADAVVAVAADALAAGRIDVCGRAGGQGDDGAAHVGQAPTLGSPAPGAPALGSPALRAPALGVTASSPGGATAGASAEPPLVRPATPTVPPTPDEADPAPASSSRSAFGSVPASGSTLVSAPDPASAPAWASTPEPELFTVPSQALPAVRRLARDARRRSRRRSRDVASERGAPPPASGSPTAAQPPPPPPARSLAESILDPRLEAPPPFVPFGGTTSRLTLQLSDAHLATPDAHPCAADAYAWEFSPAALVDDAANPYDTFEAPTSCRLGVDVPAVLGLGPLDPVTARALAVDPPSHLTVSVTPVAAGPDHDDGRTVEVTDGRTVEVTDGGGSAAGRAGYVPGAALAREVRVMHPTCVAPSCTVLASACDLDHVTPWPAGHTTAANLRPLCRHHHLVKTHLGHELTLDATGAALWRTPEGHRYRREIGGVSTLVETPDTTRPATRPRGAA